jgi:3-methyladenine DNA glycosylase AlkD
VDVPSVAEVLNELGRKAKPGNLQAMARYGLVPTNRLGVSMPDIRKLAKGIGRDHRLALELWKSGVVEARIVASLVDDPGRVSEAQAERWVRDFNSWDICDQVCQNLFEKTPWAWSAVPRWARRDEEFVRRAAFALVACLAWHDKTAPDRAFIRLFPVLKRGAADERNYVRKAVNWAVRNIGKRNVRLNRAALVLSREIQRIDSKAARWIAADAIRELESDAVRRRLKE